MAAGIADHVWTSEDIAARLGQSGPLSSWHCRTLSGMSGIGEAVKWIGFGLAGLGIASMVAGIIVKFTHFVRRRKVHQLATQVVFRSYLLVLVGIQIAVIGLILSGRLPWPFLIAVFLFGVPAVAVFRAKLEFPRD